MKNLTTKEVQFACAAINRFGSHDHPEANDCSFIFFAPDYVKRCVRTAVQIGGMTPIADKLAANVLASV